MVLATFARLARVRVTVIYAVLLVTVNTTLVNLGPDVQSRVIQHVSTNLHNLSRGHVGTLLGSAFVVDAGPVSVWLPGLVVLLGVAELLWRSWRLMLAFAIGHVGATLLVAVGLTAAVEFGWLPGSVTRATDVGMSYGAIAVLGALTAAVPHPWRWAWIGWWFGVGIKVLTESTDFTDAGHVVALTLGMAVATRFGRPARWTLTRMTLAMIASAFGYLILVSGEASIASAMIAGLVGALVGATATILRGGGAAQDRANGQRRIAQRNSSAEASTQSDRHDSGGSSTSSPGISQS